MGKYACLVSSLDSLASNWVPGTGEVFNKYMPDEKWNSGRKGMREREEGEEGNKREGKREGGKIRQEGGRTLEAPEWASYNYSSRCLKGSLLLPTVLDWVTQRDLKVTGCQPAPCSLLQPSLPQLDTTLLYKFHFFSVFLLWSFIIYCHRVINFLYVDLFSPFYLLFLFLC